MSQLQRNLVLRKSQPRSEISINVAKIVFSGYPQHVFGVSRGTLQVPPKGACGCSVGHLGKKNIQKLSVTLFAFEIFEFGQKTKKLALLSYQLGSSQGCLGVPRLAPCGSNRSNKIFFAITIHIDIICL